MQVVGHESRTVRNMLYVKEVAVRIFTASFAADEAQNCRAKSAQVLLSKSDRLDRFGRSGGDEASPCGFCARAEGLVENLTVSATNSTRPPAQLIAWRAGSNRSVAIKIARSICDSSMFAAASLAGVSSQ
jgi:hypothetical protein